MFDMKEVFGAAKDEEILFLESRLTAMLTEELFEFQSAVLLPQDYKLFLSETNGGLPKKNLFQHKNFGISLVKYYYGTGFSESDHRNILRATSSMRCIGEEFDTLIQIATDPGGLRICLGLGLDNYGKVFLFDHDAPSDEDENYLLCIADSFAEFFNNCYETEEEVEAAYANP